MIKISKSNYWKYIKINGISVHYTSNFSIDDFKNQILNNFEIDNCINFLKKHEECFSIIIETKKSIICFVDRIRSYPIFFTKRNFQITNNARLLDTDKYNLNDSNINHILMAGYCVGSTTIYDEIEQLLAGTYLIYKKKSKEINFNRYFNFLPTQIISDDISDLRTNLFSIFNHTFDNLCNKLNDRPVYIPLSGGLDSRLILSLLVLKKYKNIYTFTYGPKFNDEAKIAKYVANKLGVPWHFLPDTSKNQNVFLSNDRINYWKYSDNLSTIPVMQEYYTLKNLKKSNYFKKNSVVINGQTGDFISGGHLPNNYQVSALEFKLIYEEIKKKHLSLWKSDQYESLLYETFKENFISYKKNKYNLGNIFELWEWQERQSKYVSNQVRAYEYFGMDWFMPLWHSSLCDFWVNVPLKYKYNQHLYTDFLKHYNFFNIFNDSRLNKKIFRWQGVSLILPITARILGLLLGNKVKERFYSKTMYFGYYSNQYSSFSYNYYFKRAEKIRNPVSLFSEYWIKENIKSNFFN